MKKSENAFLLLFVLFGVQFFTYDTFLKNEAFTIESTGSGTVVFSSSNQEFIAEFVSIETILPTVNSVSIPSKNKVNSHDFGLTNSVRSEIIINNISFKIIEPSSFIISRILDFLHPYLFFY